MKTKEIKEFRWGWQNRIEAESIPDGAASDEKNVLNKGDHWEVRRGMALFGATRITGTGRVMGLHIGKRPDATEQPFAARRTNKLEYFNLTTEDWVEISSGALGSDIAASDDVAFADYSSVAGAQVFASAPDASGLYKIMVSNPETLADQYVSGTNFRSYIKVKQSRMWAWQAKNNNNTPDLTQVFGSKQDKDELSDYTSVSSESVGTGNGTTKTFTATLAFKAAGARRTCFGVRVTDGTETFVDNKNGTLVGSAGGTGTINYMTGAVSVTFNTAPANLQAITANYYWEDSTDGGIADFRYTTPTRVAGEGFFFLQGDGGNMQNIFAINDVEYCMHEFKTWALTLTKTDTNATNFPFRSKVGIPNWRAAIETGEGIYYIDDTDKKDPKFRLLTFERGSTEVVPFNKSAVLNLADYRFDKAAMIEWGEYIVIACRHKDSDDNNMVITYDKVWKIFDKHDYYVSCFAVYDGTLLAGSSIDNNVYTLFSGFDDDEASIPFVWEGKLDDFGYVDREKQMFILEVQGLIQPNQIVDVQISKDRGDFITIGQIRGDGDYVDSGQSVSIGSLTLGKGEIGGGSPGAVAYPYYRMFDFDSDGFNLEDFLQAKIKFKNGIDADTAQDGIGYFSVSLIRNKDIRVGYQRIPSKYTD